MLWFNQVKDVGEVNAETGDRLSVGGGDFAPGERPVERCAGAVVTFRVIDGDDGARATDVSFVPEVAPRRARMRHGRARSGGYA